MAQTSVTLTKFTMVVVPAWHKMVFYLVAGIEFYSAWSQNECPQRRSPWQNFRNPRRATHTG